jgi:hypothetical protein
LLLPGYSRGEVNVDSNWRTVPKPVLNAPNLPLGVCDMEFNPRADLGALAQQRTKFFDADL